MVCPICHWPEHVRQWRRRMKYVLEQMCGEKTSPASEAERAEVPGVRVGEVRGRTPPGHRRTSAAGDLLVSQVPRESGPACREAVEESKEVRSWESVRALRTSSEGAAGPGEVLQQGVRHAVQGEEVAGRDSRTTNELPRVREAHRGEDSEGKEVLQPVVCNHSSKFAVDASRADQLRCAGNAVVPLQAAVAFVELMRRVMSRR